MIRKLPLILIIVLLTMPVSGCWDRRELDTLAITSAIGIDKLDNQYIVTVQIINPQEIASKKGSGKSPVVIYTTTGHSLIEALRRLTTESPRKIYVAHLRIVVLGEDLVKEGIAPVLDFLFRDHETRTDFYFLVAKGTTAQKALNVLTPLEKLPGQSMYASLETSEKTWAPTKTVKVDELTNALISDGKSAVITGLVINDDNQTQPEKKSTYRLEGMAALKKDKLTGWLNEDESKGYNYIMGNVKNTVGVINLPGNEQVNLEVRNAKTVRKAMLVNGQPAIDIDIRIECNIAEIKSTLDISKAENIAKIEKAAEAKNRSICRLSLDRVQKELKTDIFGFGEMIHRSSPKTWKQLKTNWDENFSTLPVNINVTVKVRQMGEISKSLLQKGASD